MHAPVPPGFGVVHTVQSKHAHVWPDAVLLCVGVLAGDGWQGWGHWLGTGKVATFNQQFLPFEMALAFSRTLNLEGKKEWHEWRKSGARPSNVPSDPYKVYQHAGWQGYGHWLGTGNVSTKPQKEFLPFHKALRFARALKLATNSEWNAWCKGGERPGNIPSSPHRTYKNDGWEGWGHWLGTLAARRRKLSHVVPKSAAASKPKRSVSVPVRAVTLLSLLTHVRTRVHMHGAGPAPFAGTAGPLTVSWWAYVRVVTCAAGLAKLSRRRWPTLQMARPTRPTRLAGRVGRVSDKTPRK